MKPSFFDRMLLILFSLLGMVVGIVFILLAFGIFSLEAIYNIVQAFGMQLGSFNFGLVLGGIGVVFFLVCLRLMIGFNKKGNRVSTPPPATTALIAQEEFGTTRITLAAIDAMVQRHCRANNQVREASSVIKLQEDGSIAIELKLVLLNETNVPETTSKLRASLKEYLEGLTGIKAENISMMVVTAPAQQLAKSGTGKRELANG